MLALILAIPLLMSIGYLIKQAVLILDLQKTIAELEYELHQQREKSMQLAQCNKKLLEAFEFQFEGKKIREDISSLTVSVAREQELIKTIQRLV